MFQYKTVLYNGMIGFIRSPEHMLYPKEIAKMFGIQDLKAFNKALLVFNDIVQYAKYYYVSKSGKEYRCYPEDIWLPVVKEFIKQKEDIMADKRQKTCPHCGGNVFLASITIPGIVGVFEDEDGNNTYDILKKSENKMGVQIIKCSKCKELVNEEELVTEVPCKECGQLVAPGDLNEEGICSICEAKKNRPDLVNMSQEELLRKYLELEKMTNKAAKKIEKKIQAGEDDQQDDTAGVSEDITEEATPVTEEPVAEEKPKRKRRKKKVDNTEDAADTTDEQAEDESEDNNVSENEVPEEVTGSAEETVTEEEAAQEADNLAQAQEAPFPDVQTEDPGPAEQMLPVEEAPAPQGVNGFALFDDDGEKF